MELIERKEKHIRERARKADIARPGRRRTRRRLRSLQYTERKWSRCEMVGLRERKEGWRVGKVEQWVDKVHIGHTDVQVRVMHAMRCLVSYIKGKK